MVQVLLSGTKAWDGTTITIWADGNLKPGDSIRWNGCPWKVSAVYGTRYCAGDFASKREKPNEGPLERFN